MRIIRSAPAAANVSANSTAAQVFPDSITPTNACVLTAPGSGVLEKKRFTVLASGNVTTAGAYTVTVSLYAKVAVPATPLTASNWTLLKASTGQTVSTTSCPWWIEARLAADTLSGKLHGTFAAMINNLYDVHAALTNPVTSVDLSTAGVDPALNFMVAVTFGTGSASNVARMQQFVLGF